MHIFTANKNVKKIVSFVVFICMALFLYTRVTYLFREVSCSRDTITGFEEEEKLDVVCIGSSTIVEYYQPLTAWKNYGYTSYAYGTLYGQMELYWRYIDRVLQTQEPELFVVDIRMLSTMAEQGYEQGLRFWTDSLPVFAKDRCLSIKDYLNTHTMDGNNDRLTYYFDIAKYHTNGAALASKDNWQYMNNKGNSDNKGYELSSDHHFFEKPVVTTKEKAELSQLQSEVLYQLLDYCKEKNLNVLFVVCPYIVSEEDQRVYNAAQDIVNAYGYHFINFNHYYDEMKLDFSSDMKNINHVNCAGAEKYTNFLADYIVKTYNISSHSSDISYSGWDEKSERFSEKLTEGKMIIDETIKDKRDAADLASYLAQCDNPVEWSLGVQNDNYTVISCAKLQECNLDKMNVESSNLLEKWNINSDDNGNYLRVNCGDEVIFEEKTSDELQYNGYLGVIDGLGQIPYEVHIGDEMSLLIKDTEYILNDNEITLLLYDNNYKKVVDRLAFSVTDDGAVKIDR